MSLVPDYEDSSDSSSSSGCDSSGESEGDGLKRKETMLTSPAGDEGSEDVDDNKSATRAKLPLPEFAGNCDPKSSVFANPFVEEENAKKAMLEKHVKMVNNAKETLQRTINGKRICWNYRKGKCRFGHNCIYAHDSDLQKSDEQLEAERSALAQQTVLFQSQKTMPQLTPGELQKIRDEATGSGKKRKRPGLTQGLIPGKKVMSKYLNQKK